MKTRIFIFLLGAVFFYACGPDKKNEVSMNPDAFVKDNMSFAAGKLQAMMAADPDPANAPRSIDENGNLVTTKTSGWTSGFFPGELWYLYQYTKEEDWKKYAQKYTEPLAAEKDNTHTHDLGFMLYCSFGNGDRLTDNPEYKQILIDGANSLITRFNPKVGVIRSWDHGDWEYPVIIDNMMNLEFLFWATKATGDSTYYKIAVSHADTTLKNHFRDDWSSYHVVNYDTITGNVISKETHQGYSDESAWARGQAWGLYGYTMCYRETKDPKYLNAAEHIAGFILHDKNMPEDMVPYWDFDAPDIPNAKRDVSAAAILSSALFELSDYSEHKQEYFDDAVKILQVLASPKYKAVDEKNGNFILKHAVGHMPKNSEVDVPLVYADYYFIEALLRYQQRAQGKDS